MRQILVIRFGALGDLCQLGWSLAALADQLGRERPRVTLVTKAAWAPLAARLRGVDEVAAPDGGGLGPLRRLAARLRPHPWDQVLDAHGVLRALLLCGLLGRRPDARLAKDTGARLRLLAAARRNRGPGADLALPAGRTMGERFDRVLGAALPGGGRLAPAAAPPLVDASATRAASGPLGLAPGAQWDTKRWPADRYLALAELALGSGVPLRVFLGPREEGWFPGSELARGLDRRAGVELVRGSALPVTAAALAACRALVTNDSGLLHLAEAQGVPVAAFFGPTVRQFGYFPRLPASRVLGGALGLPSLLPQRQAPLPARGDLACLTGIGVDAAWDALRAMEAFP